MIGRLIGCRIGAGFNYPLSLWQRCLTFFGLFFSTIWIFFLDPDLRKFQKPRHEAGLKGPLPVFGGFPGKTLCMSSDPQLEYPCIVPPRVVSCGPILLPNKSLVEVDPELLTWLEKGPVIMIVLGSNLMMTQSEAESFKTCLRTVLGIRKDLKLLWKIQKLGEVSISPADLLKGGEKAEDRVRIVNWLEADPVAILETGHVAISVNHGGSNCYHEAQK